MDAVYILIMFAVFGIPALILCSTETFKNIKENRRMQEIYGRQAIKKSPWECPRCSKPLFPAFDIVTEGIHFSFVKSKFLEIKKDCTDDCGWEEKLVVPWNGYSWSDGE